MIFIDFGLLRSPYCKISYLLAEERWRHADNSWIDGKFWQSFFIKRSQTFFIFSSFLRFFNIFHFYLNVYYIYGKRLLVTSQTRVSRVGCGEGCTPSSGEGIWGGARPLPQKTFLLFDLKMEHFGAVFKLDLTEETRTQLQGDTTPHVSYIKYSGHSTALSGLLNTISWKVLVGLSPNLHQWCIMGQIWMH